ncbi:NUDIX hydrolase [Sulfobacillus thermosulfidooxidans]|uniref:NUDIX hydrolase n=1 Tax=Sulfobacillus thermosulfidooxidans TaxID=28034 RepID=UPI0006B5BB60|nr:NUDIX hydrolase [Sulfobacillus thermosulfidooxidans]
MEHRSGPGQWVYQGRTISVRVDPVKVRTIFTSREVVVRVPAVAVIAETRDAQIVMIKQYRWAVGQWLYELPAGKVDGTESPLVAAKRELQEETGYMANEWRLVRTFYPTPGYSDEKIFLFYARDLTYAQTHLDADEEIDTELWDTHKIRAFLESADDINGIALTGLQWWLCKDID